MNDALEIIRLQQTYCDFAKIAPSTLAKRIGGLSGKFFDRIRSGSTCNLNTALRITRWFSDNWPAGLAWPSDIPRPAPQARGKDAA